jgi:hypothetical protein
LTKLLLVNPTPLEIKVLYPNATTASCRLMVDGDYRQQPRTSDLGDDELDQHEHAEHRHEIEASICNQFGLSGCSTAECGLNLAAGQLHQQAFGIDSDGMSSQGTHKSSLTTTNNPTSTTLGSPSSGYGPEPCCDQAGACKDQQQMVRCDVLMSAAKSAGLRHTKKSVS